MHICLSSAIQLRTTREGVFHFKQGSSMLGTVPTILGAAL